MSFVLAPHETPGAGLTRVMVGESRIDHIFARTDDRYAFEVIKTEPIEAAVKLGEKEISLSDHTGYMSTITIRPNETTTNRSEP